MLMHGPPKAGGPSRPRSGGKLIGAHAFSRDARTWNESTTPPCESGPLHTCFWVLFSRADTRHMLPPDTSLVNFSNGSSFDMRRRERPQLLLSDSGQPRFFSTGVEDFGEHTYTLVMRVNS